MIFSHYNIFSIPRAAVFILFGIIASAFYTINAQQLSSRTMSQNMEKFLEYRTTDRDTAHIYAERIIADLDSTVVGEDVAILYDFMAEYNESVLHRYEKALDY